ncbi:DUF6449 domain-containing protein [Bacillus sp. FJAT-29790]|uniref:DUF6449 domain-containing protein n=1 Tax=Bacillus sp. FJAT-29790 TaxID=1895002 RepID=UPI0020B375DE|nr:DUF6449 domain-containing protein [Bacillus sp. FJAT-29790]
MQSKISLVNREFWLTITRSVGWVSIVYFLGLFICIPMNILMNASGEKRLFVRVGNLFQHELEIQFILMIGIPVLLAVFLFRFLQVKQYSDLIHSLPIKRERIFHQYAIAGFIYLTLPVIFIALILLALYIPLELSDFFTISEIFSWLGITILFNTLIYMSGVMLAMVTGVSAVQGALTYVLLLLPLGFLTLINFNLPYFLYGFPSEYFSEIKYVTFSPIVAAGDLYSRPIGTTVIISYLFVTLILYGLALVIYKRRKVEAVSQALVFPILKPIFIYGVTFCAMLVGGLYLGTMGGDKLWVVAGYVFGAILGYYIAEMVLQKTWRVFNQVKGLLIYTGVMAVVVILFQFDFTQYEKKIPNIDEIERVHLSNSPYYYRDSIEDGEGRFYLQEPDNIALVRGLQKEIIADKHKNKAKKSEHKWAFFIYELKNGKKMVRNYVIDEREYANYYQPIYESKEYKMKTNEIFQVKDEQVDRISILTYGPIDKRVVIAAPSEIKEVIEVLKDDVDSATFEQIIDEKEGYATIELLLSDKKTVGMEWRRSYKGFDKWLEQKGLRDQAKVTVDDLSYALIVPRKDLQFSPMGFNHEELFAEMEKATTVLKVTDKSMLEESLENAHWSSNGKYIVGFYYKNNRTIYIQSFAGKDIPDFVKEHFQ